MKNNMKKVLALVLAALLVLTLCSMAFAEGETTITITRHSTWNSAADNAKATYTPYKIFDAVKTGSNYVYTLTSDEQAAVLPSIFTKNKAADNKWYITVADGTTGVAIAEALNTMITNNPTLFPAGTAVTSDAASVVLTVASDGYYFIKASNGKNFVANTAIGTTLSITEKNDYPTIDKKQKKAAGDTYVDTAIEAEIGKVINYQITVHIPADANKAIAVIDKMSAGLTYNNNFAATIDGVAVDSTDLASEDAGYVATAPTGYTIPFQKKFAASLVEANRGKDIVITYTATVNNGALEPTGRENEAKLVYDEGNYILHDSVPYTTYFAGIEKVDGTTTTTKLSGVKFNLTVGEEAYNVTKVTVDGGQDYYVPGGSSNEVVTGDNGLIIIRGLDNTITYTLTETETNAGYNLLHGSKNLTLVEDKAENPYATATYDQVLNYQGAELPSTGGIGTTIFYVSGLIMVLGAATILISRRRAESK